jgi:hypothetical protein
VNCFNRDKRQNSEGTAMKQKQNIYALLKEILSRYANVLRAQYQKQTIRNAAVFDSAIREFSRSATLSWSIADEVFLREFLPF